MISELNKDELISCGICLVAYNNNERIPHMIYCGHTICKECFNKLIVNQQITCPFDKKCYKKEDFAIIFSLLSLVDQEYKIKDNKLISEEISKQESVKLCPNNHELQWSTWLPCSCHSNNTRSEYKGFKCPDCKKVFCDRIKERRQCCRSLLRDYPIKKLEKKHVCNIHLQGENYGLECNECDFFICHKCLDLKYSISQCYEGHNLNWVNETGYCLIHKKKVLSGFQCSKNCAYFLCIACVGYSQ